MASRSGARNATTLERFELLRLLVVDSRVAASCPVCAALSSCRILSMSAGDIAHHLGLPHRAAARLLAAAIDDGVLARDGAAWYRFPCSSCGALGSLFE